MQNADRSHFMQAWITSSEETVSNFNTWFAERSRSQARKIKESLFLNAEQFLNKGPVLILGLSHFGFDGIQSDQLVVN